MSFCCPSSITVIDIPYLFLSWSKWTQNCSLSLEPGQWLEKQWSLSPSPYSPRFLPPHQPFLHQGFIFLLFWGKKWKTNNVSLWCYFSFFASYRIHSCSKVFLLSIFGSNKQTNQQTNKRETKEKRNKQTKWTALLATTTPRFSNHPFFLVQQLLFMLLRSSKWTPSGNQIIEPLRHTKKTKWQFNWAVHLFKLFIFTNDNLGCFHNKYLSFGCFQKYLNNKYLLWSTTRVLGSPPLILIYFLMETTYFLQTNIFPDIWSWPGFFLTK